MSHKITKKCPQDVTFKLDMLVHIEYKCIQCICSQGFAPDPTEGTK